MSIATAAAFVLITRRRVVLAHHWKVLGGVYGVLIFFVMNYAVGPLSALHTKPHLSDYSFIANFAAMLVFGGIVALATSNLWPSRDVAAAKP